MPKGDVLLHAGDVTMRGLRSELLDFLLWFGNQPHTCKIFIGGNHDFCLEKLSHAQIESMLPPGVIYLNDSGINIEGIEIWGSPVTPWHHNWAFNRHRGAHIRRHWQKIPAQTNLLLTHTPSFGTLDQMVNGRNNGDKDLLNTIEVIKPDLHVFGHIHEAYGTKKIQNRRYINCALMNESYEMVNKPVVFTYNKSTDALTA